MTTKYYAKCICDKIQLNDRLTRSNDGLELQIRYDDPTNLVNDYLSREVEVVHAPLAFDARTPIMFHKDFPVDFPNTWGIHRKYLEVVQLKAKLHQRSIRYVMHIHQTYKVLNWDTTYFSLLQELKGMARDFPNVILCLENTAGNYNDLYTTAKIARDCAHERIGTCLDICHAQIMIHDVLAIKEGHERVPGFDDVVSLKEFFAQNAPFLKLIHLNHAKNSGSGFGRGKGHSLCFTEAEEDMALLKEILGYYSENDLDCPMTIEVAEEDYNRAENYSKTIGLIRKL